MNKVTEHISKNRKVYGVLAGGIAVGSIGTFLVFYGRGVVINDSLNVSVNSPKTNLVVQMVRPGPKSHAIQCLETQQTWPSIRQAAKDLGLNASEISEHLNGKKSSVKDLSFSKIGEL